MSNREMTNTERVIGLGIAGLLIYGLVSFAINQPNSTSSRTPSPTRQPSSLTVSRTSTPRPTNTPAPSPTIDSLMMTREGIEFYGVTFEAPSNSLIAQGDFELRNCPQFGCDVVGTVEAGQRLVIVAGVVGESMEGFEGWVIINSDDILRYAHLYEVLPMDATAQANRTPTVNAPNYGSRIETAEEWVSLPNDVDFRSCPLLSCDVMREAQKDERVLGVGFISGEIANDISFDMWAIVRFGDVELFAPMSDVFPPEDGE